MTRSDQALPVLVAGCPGWLHLPPGGRARGRGVLLCGPETYELVPTRRSLWHLAQRCAEAGLPALRFDPPGIGDHPEEEASGQLEAWSTALVEAADWLARHSCLAEVALCGLRFGALVAAQAAASRPGHFAALALLAPVASGRVHRRSLTLAAQASTPAHDGTWLELGGHRLHGADLDLLASWDLPRATAAAAAPRVLVMDRRPPLAAGLPGVVTAPLFEGIERLLTHPHMSRLPVQAFARVAAWLAEDAPPASAPPAPPLPAPPLVVEGGTERAVRFGPDGRLTGVLCLPAAACARRIAVLLLNTGAAPRASSGRFAVRAARRLAHLGIASLRLDAPGIGDSDPVAGAKDPSAPPDMFRDGLADELRAGLDLLVAHGTARCLVAGVCSGADTALRLALRDGRVDAIALFNLPAFDRTQGGAAALDGGPPPDERPWLRRPRMLLRRLRAEVDLAIATGLGIEARLDRPGRWMRALAARGTRVLLAYSTGDRGLRELRAHFGRGGCRLAALPSVRRVMLDGIDHSVSQRAMQEQALRLIEEEALRLDPAAAPARRAAAAVPSTATNSPLPTFSPPGGWAASRQPQPSNRP